MKILSKNNALKNKIYPINFPIMKRLHIDIDWYTQCNDDEQDYDLNLGDTNS
jgi:hypothetical protein